MFQGVKFKNELKVLKETLSAFNILSENNATWKKARLLSNEIRKKGCTVKTIENNCFLYSLDKYFKRITKYSKLKLLEV